MNEQAANYSGTKKESNVVATSNLREALRVLKVPEQAIMILSGFRALTPKRDLI